MEKGLFYLWERLKKGIEQLEAFMEAEIKKKEKGGE